MSGQVSRGSAGEDQADERAGVTLSLLVFCVVLLCITKPIPNRHRFYDIFSIYPF